VERIGNKSKRKYYGKVGGAKDVLSTDLHRMVMMPEENTEMDTEDEWRQWK
jgi:hypothetical protein